MFIINFLLVTSILTLRCSNQPVRRVSAVSLKEKQSSKMQAWQLHSYGDLKEVQLTMARYPLIRRPNELLIKVHAASVNPIDTLMIGGYGKTILSVFRGFELEFPLTLGRDFAGTIIDKGHGVGNAFNIGDDVYGVLPVHKQGSHAELVIAEKEHVLKKPPHLSAVEAASILFTSVTAWSALYLTGELLIRNANQSKILILGASGGVGSMAVQMLKSQGANVTATCSADAVPLVQSLGADQVLDYKGPSYINDVAARGRFDIILDCAPVGYQNIPKTWEHKIYISLDSPLLLNTDKHGLAGGLVESLADLLQSNVGRCPYNKSVRWAYFLPLPEGLRFIDGLVNKKMIKPIIQKVYKFQDAPQAYEALMKKHTRGKIMIDMQST